MGSVRDVTVSQPKRFGDVVIYDFLFTRDVMLRPANPLTGDDAESERRSLT